MCRSTLGAHRTALANYTRVRYIVITFIKLIKKGRNTQINPGYSLLLWFLQMTCCELADRLFFRRWDLLKDESVWCQSDRPILACYIILKGAAVLKLYGNMDNDERVHFANATSVERRHGISPPTSLLYTLQLPCSRRKDDFTANSKMIAQYIIIFYKYKKYIIYPHVLSCGKAFVRW